jgi:hypothetical protein
MIALWIVIVVTGLGLLPVFVVLGVWSLRRSGGKVEPVTGVDLVLVLVFGVLQYLLNEGNIRWTVGLTSEYLLVVVLAKILSIQIYKIQRK